MSYSRHAYNAAGNPYYTGVTVPYPGYPYEEGGTTPPTLTNEDLDAYFAASLNAATWEALSEETQAAAQAEAERWLSTLCLNDGADCCGRSFEDAYLMVTAELALALAQNPKLLAATEATPGLYVSEKHLGDMGKSFAAFDQASVKYGATAPLLLHRLPFVGEILGGWINNSWGRSRVLSRC